MAIRALLQARCLSCTLVDDSGAPRAARRILYSRPWLKDSARRLTLTPPLSRLFSPIPSLHAIVRMDPTSRSDRRLLFSDVVRAVPRERPGHAGADHRGT